LIPPGIPDTLRRRRARKTYVEDSSFFKGERAASKLLPSFGVEVTETQP
jgi:chlorite dismutase